MKKWIPLVLFAPFVVVTVYYVIEKYIYFLFNAKDEFLVGTVTMFLTMGVIGGIAGLIINEVTK